MHMKASGNGLPRAIIQMKKKNENEQYYQVGLFNLLSYAALGESIVISKTLKCYYIT